jgi:hypothetical protein
LTATRTLRVNAINARSVFYWLISIVPRIRRRYDAGSGRRRNAPVAWAQLVWFDALPLQFRLGDG